MLYRHERTRQQCEISAVKRIRVEYKNPLKRGKAIKALVYTDEGRKFVELCDENNKPYCITEYDYRS